MCTGFCLQQILIARADYHRKYSMKNAYLLVA